MKDYNLIYYRKDSGHKYFGKRITPVDYRLMDSETLELSDWTHHKLSQTFLKDEQNKKFRLPRETMAKKRGIRMNSKAFQEYLYGTAY